MPDIFQYTDFRAYLRDWKNERRRARSTRAVATKLNCSAALISALLNEDVTKQRNMSVDLVEAFCSVYRLSPEEAEYFTLLVSFDQAQSEVERDQVWLKLSAKRRFQDAHRVQDTHYKFFSQWYNLAIFELSHTPHFRADPAWLSSILQPPITDEEAASALSLLEELQLLQRDEDGALRPIESVVRDDPGIDRRVNRLAIFKFHQWVLSRAGVALDEVPVSERVYLATTMAVPEELIPQVKQRFHTCLTEIMTMCEESELPANRIFQAGVQFFPITAPMDSDEPDS